MVLIPPSMERAVPLHRSPVWIVVALAGCGVGDGSGATESDDGGAAVAGEGEAEGVFEPTPLPDGGEQDDPGEDGDPAAPGGEGEASTDTPGSGEGEGEPDAPDGEGEGEGEGEGKGEGEGEVAPPADGPAAYHAGRRHSPVTGAVAERWREILDAGQGRRDTFIKVGASATVSRNFMRCFPGDRVDLAGRDELQETLDAFTDESFTRDSLVATVGWSAWKAIAPSDGGGPSPLAQELAAMRPSVAVVMYGTNDIQGRNVDRYGDSMLTLARTLVQAGVVPILTTIMPRDDDPAADARVPVYNGVVRAVAQALQIPLVDYEAEVRRLADHGIGPDGIHPTNRGGGCDLTEDGLLGGYNVRNLLTLEALHRIRRAAFGPEPRVLDADAPPINDTIRTLPYVAYGDTSEAPPGRLDEYTGCGADQDESGPEVLYTVAIGRDVGVRAVVIDQDDVDVDVHVLGPDGDEEDCIARAHTELTADLPGGIGFLSVDSFVSRQGVELSGEYLLVVLEDESGNAGGGGGPAEEDPAEEDPERDDPAGEDPPAECDPDDDVRPNAGLREAPGDDGCPAGMASIPGDPAFCMDRYEASLTLPDGEEWSPYHHPNGGAVLAVSRAGAVPQGYIDGHTAAAACEAADKRLCTDAEWLAACRGAADRTYPYGDVRTPGACNDARARHPAVELFPDDPTPFDRIQDACINQLDDSLAPTGAHPDCVTPDGVFDLMGNLHEWTAARTGTFRGGFYVDTVRNGPGCLYATTAHNREHWDYSTGFRCCADL